MTTAEQQKQISDSVTKIIEATKTSQIRWTRANPTTFVWTSPAARVMIQRVEQSSTHVDPTTRRPIIRKVVSFLLQTISMPSNTQVLSITSEDTTNAALLETLYNTVEETLLSQGLDLLRTILPR